MSSSKTNWLSDQFPHEPTGDQQKALLALAELFRADEKRKGFILTGYAGTGKTTMVGHVVKVLLQRSVNCHLLAPTGRAAKVFSGFAGQKAFTIHKKIYRKQKVANGSIQLVLAPNFAKKQVFIVDEASMIGDYTLSNSGEVNERNLLEDLVEYVYKGEGCVLVMVGDEGQLPPVGADHSPALNLKGMQMHFPLISWSGASLKQVLRQSENSDILLNATQIRKLKPGQLPAIKNTTNGDVKIINGLEVQEALEYAYQQAGKDNCMIITRSNKRANAYNQEIRRRILFHEEELVSGDLLMAVRNSYFWVPETSDAGFIANGELLQVKRVRKWEELYGFRFCRVEASLPDYPEMDSFELLLLMDTISTEAPSLGREQMKALFFEIEKDYADERNKQKRYEKILADPYFNALQIKFAYAVTCHKAQGGQWDYVFIDHGYLGEDHPDPSFQRWLYTAFTRAKETLYLINPDERFVK